MGTEKGGEAVDVEREEDGENLELVMAERRESKAALEEGGGRALRRERRMGAKRGGEAIGAREREEDGENLQVSAGGNEGVGIGGGREAVGVDEVFEHLYGIRVKSRKKSNIEQSSAELVSRNHKRRRHSIPDDVTQGIRAVYNTVSELQGWRHILNR
ncbi:hypothetical protein Syun_028049 [Stephania yunnanensis]|uniref:Uncharacterized protein n=1 Tax=Stephania yunnanensis TaxID=152371 RepID=A0AAP0EM79_9MAGN